MCKLLALLSICLALSVVRSDSTTCADTTNLRTLYGLGNTLTTPQTYSDIKYCKSIKGSPVCCTNTDMNTFQTKTDKVLTNLSSVAGARDKFLYDAVANVLPNLQTTITTFKTSFGSLGSSLGALGGSSDAFDSDVVLGALTNITDFLSASGSDLKTQFTSYQKARSTCITQMVKFQTAAFCLACDPSAASKGYSYSNSYHSFDISETVCTRMDTACSSYFTTAVAMSAVSQVAASVQVMVKLNDLVAKIQKLTAAGDINGIMALMTDMTDIFTPTTTDVTTGPVEPVCDPSVKGDCKSYCAFLFYDGTIDQEVLALAGNPSSLDSMYGDSGRLLRNFARKESRADGGRMLTSSSSSFNPDEEESGVEVTFAQDPAGTQTTSKFGSLSLGNVFVSMMVVISAILLF